MPEKLAEFQLFHDLPTGPIGVAVSGGSDSLALLHLLHAWQGRQLSVATVDHQLRRESADEAQMVANICAGLGVPHRVLHWHDAEAGSNLQDRARNARKNLLAQWAAETGLSAVALGHTQDDQAETVLMRLTRGSGVDGLAGMAPISASHGTVWVRPILRTPRKPLRDYLLHRGIGWIDDPSNTAREFTRVQVRNTITVLEAQAPTRETLVDTAERMAMAREVLVDAAKTLAQRCATADALGYVRIDTDTFRAAPVETRLRLLAHCLNWVSGSTYRPRFKDLRRVSDAVQTGEGLAGRTLHGCILRVHGRDLTICREVANAGAPVEAGQIWDGRWQTGGSGDLMVGPLKDTGLHAFPDWRDSGHPRDALLASPAFWRDGQLISAFFLSKPDHNAVQLMQSAENCFTTL